MPTPEPHRPKKKVAWAPNKVLEVENWKEHNAEFSQTDAEFESAKFCQTLDRQIELNQAKRAAADAVVARIHGGVPVDAPPKGSLFANSNVPDGRLGPKKRRGKGPDRSRLFEEPEEESGERTALLKKERGVLEIEDGKKPALQHTWTKTEIVPSRIVLAAIVVVVLAQQLAGISVPFGLSAAQGVPEQPEQGRFLKSGSQDFSQVDALLHLAVPVTWRGAAADKYTAANEQLMTAARQMAELDHTMADAVRTHGGVVDYTRWGLGIVQNALVSAYFSVWYLETNGAIPLAYKIALAVSTAAGVAGIGLLANCVDHSKDRATQAHELTYHHVASAARLVIAAYQLAGHNPGR